MSTANPDGSVQPGEIIVPNENERARTAFTKRITDEISRLFSETNSQHTDNQNIAAYIGNSVMNRLYNRFHDMTEEGKTEIFEAAPGINDTHIEIDASAQTTNMIVPKKFEMDDSVLVVILEEFNRAQLLARANNINFSGTLKINGGSSNVHVGSFLDTYRSVYKKDQQIYATAYHNKILKADMKPNKNEPESAIYDRDPELFADMMIAFGARLGAGKNGASFNEAWKRMPGQGFDNYGTSINYTEEGVPYRPGKRKEDVEMLTRKAAEFGTKEPAIKTYGELAIETSDLKRKTQVLEDENSKLKTAKSELASDLADVQSGLDTVDHRENMKSKDLAEEKAAREAAEAKNVALEARIKELVAIAEEKGKLLGDTRLDRIKQVGSSPLPEQSPK